MAREATSERDRASWLRLASGWLSLIPGEPVSEADRFDEAARNRGTGQEITDRSQ
jgi:hypothetical protein